MSSFDEFAKLLAESQVTRRETLRKMGAGIVSSALAMVGIGCDSPTSPVGISDVTRTGIAASSSENHDDEFDGDGKCRADNKSCKTHANCCKGYCDPSGTCGCKSGTTNCNGICTYTSMDSANCGACGHVCPAGKACVQGVCMAVSGGTCPCPTGQVACGGICVDLRSSNANCGACGTVCPAGFFVRERSMRA